MGKDPNANKRGRHRPIENLTGFAISPNDVHHGSFHNLIPLGVTKNLTRKEIQERPDVNEAIKREARDMIADETWLEETVEEESKIKEWAKKEGVKIYIGELLTLGGIKKWEMSPEHHVPKGRICYRGDDARDENNASACYQELSASPTGIHAVNANIAYGSMLGNKTTTSDAVPAYLQSILKSNASAGIRQQIEL